MCWQELEGLLEAISLCDRELDGDVAFLRPCRHTGEVTDASDAQSKHSALDLFGVRLAH